MVLKIMQSERPVVWGVFRVISHSPGVLGRQSGPPSFEFVNIKRVQYLLGARDFCRKRTAELSDKNRIYRQTTNITDLTQKAHTLQW